MRLSFLKPAAAAATALCLAACNATTGILPANEPAHISKVQVSLAPNLTASGPFAEKLRARTMQDVARFGRAGAAKELRISVQRHSYKNAAMSLLIGDANYAGARVAVVDVASGRVQGEADASAIDRLAINGVVGAIIAASQDKQLVDQRLADGLARDVLTKAYGSSAAAAAFERPTAAETEKPGAAPSPAAPPKQVPVALAGKGRTAMAQPAPAAAAR